MSDESERPDSEHPRRRHRSRPHAQEPTPGKRGGFRLPVRTQPIAGTEFWVIEATLGGAADVVRDADDLGIDDRDFAVRAVHRQLEGPSPLTFEDVRSWPDERLLAAGRALLSLPQLEVSVGGSMQPQDPGQGLAIPEPLTFASLREALRAWHRQENERVVAALADVASTLPSAGINNLIASALRTGSIGANTALIGGRALETAKIAANSPIFNGLASLQRSVAAFDKLVEPIERPSYRVPRQPEVVAMERLVQAVSATSKDEITVLTAQAELARSQGEAIVRLEAEMKGMRTDQRWPSRGVVVERVVAILTLLAAAGALLLAIVHGQPTR